MAGDVFATILAGLGLFFVGVKLIGSNLTLAAGRRLRAWLERYTANPVSAAAIGTLAGAATQSTNAVAFILISLITAGILPVANSFAVLAWANVGTSALVLLATIDIHLLVLLLLAASGLCFHLDMDKSNRWRHHVGALLGIGLLFLGLQLIKAGAAPLRGFD
jgi:phosphate:Na+ symporter